MTEVTAPSGIPVAATAVPHEPEQSTADEPHQVPEAMTAQHSSSNAPATGETTTGDTAAPANTLVELPQKRPHDALLASHHPHIEPPHESWDGSPEIPYISHSTLFCEFAAEMLRSEGYAVLTTDLTTHQSESEAEASTDGEETHQKNRLMSRKEAKALEREIPWRHIMNLPKAEIQQYVESAQKEERGWQRWGSIEEITPERAKQIMDNPVTRKRILRSRACYRNKSRVPGQLQAKTRVVALGHLDPDLAQISRDSPTPTRTSEYLLLAVFAAGINGLMEDDPVKWILWAGDVSTAFLQGKQDMSERPDELYLLPPQDPLTKLARTFTAPLYRVTGNIYGLASAPRTWYKEVVPRLLSIDFIQHSLDHLLFYKRQGDRLVAMCIVYVDDVLLTCRSDYNKAEILDLFSWGASNQLSLESGLEFKAKS